MGTPSRFSAFSAVFNFRDLGGYPALGGREVRWGRLFRSDSLSRLTPQDKEAFATLGIRTVLDLRRPSEVERDGRVPMWEGLAYRHVHPGHPQWRPADYDPAGGPARYLADRYHELAESGAAGLVEAVSIVAATENAPIVVHCVAGKDRTGVVTALVLSLLGVEDEHIADDYALTDSALTRYVAWRQATDPTATAPKLSPFDWCPREAMLLFLAELRARYGSIGGYLSSAGLDPAAGPALRAHLLTEPHARSTTG